MNAIDIIAPADTRLAEHAEVIRALGKRAVADIIEIGRRLIDAKERCEHGGFLPWIKREFGWSERTAQGFMLVAEAVGKSANFADLNLPVSGLYLLSAPSTPAEVIEAVAEQSKGGKRLSLAEVKTMIAAANGKVVDAERKKAEAQIAKLTAAHAKEVAALREEAEKADPGMSLEEIEALVEKAVEPLKKRIEKYKEQLKRPKPKTIPNPHGSTSTAVMTSLERLIEAMKAITPAQMIEAQGVVAKVTGQPVKQGLADVVANARFVSIWSKEFLARAEKLK